MYGDVLPGERHLGSWLWNGTVRLERHWWSQIVEKWMIERLSGLFLDDG